MTQILYFGRLSDITGIASENIDIPTTVATVGNLRDWADHRHTTDGIFHENTVRIAIDGEIVNDQTILHNPVEIAFMPPVGGG